MSDIFLKVLGVASAMPISDKDPSAQVLSVHGRLFLIDCGEGTQKSMRLAHLSFLKIEAVFISHIHGDHMFGLFGLLSTMAMLGRTQVLHVYGPEALGPVIGFYLSYWGEGTGFEIVHHALKMREPEVIHVSKRVKVSAFPLRHRVETYGFRFDEIIAPKRPVPARYAEAAAAAARPPRRPVSYAYCSDTEPFDELPGWVAGVDLLYHEATYTEKFVDKARKHHHSTAAEAARCAVAAGAGRLVLGHYSSRVRDIKELEREARSIFPESYAADQGDEFAIENKTELPDQSFT